MTTAIAQTPLHDWHAAHGGRMVDFAGWSMPVQYESIVSEHQATRTAATLFDVSHMGRLRFDSDQAPAILDRLVTRRVSDLREGRIRYGLIVDEQGGTLDDVLVYRVVGHDAQPYCLMVVNASNREKIVAWLLDHGAGEAGFRDVTLETAMIAVQGPRAIGLVAPFLSADPGDMKYYTSTSAEFNDWPVLVSRTGYTGEDGVELIVPTGAAEPIWQTILRAGSDVGIVPAGLGSRDTLRLEAGMPLYGHELSDQINPWQAGLDFAVNLADREFIGRDALVRLKEDASLPQRVGLTMDRRRVPREGYQVFQVDQPVGEITSGTFSPTLDRPIAMALVSPSATDVGTDLTVDIRGSRLPAQVVKLPFYTRRK